MRKLALLGLVLVVSSISCASTAVLFDWKERDEIVCERVKTNKKKFRIFPVYEKRCAKIKKLGWVNVSKMELKGMTVKADFVNKTMSGGSFIPPIPLKLESN